MVQECQQCPDEQAAFIDLYRGIRDRNLLHDMSILQKALQALSLQYLSDACALLTKLIQHKEDCHRYDLAAFYRRVERQIHCGMVDETWRAIKDELRGVKFEVYSSPWDKPSRYDAHTLREL
jgi:hypothetical protein